MSKTELVNERQNIRRGKYLLSSTDAEAGVYYQVVIYVIRAGDTWAGIAHKSNVSLKRLFELNPGVQTDRLVVGQRIRVSEDRADLPRPTSP